MVSIRTRWIPHRVCAAVRHRVCLDARRIARRGAVGIFVPDPRAPRVPGARLFCESQLHPGRPRWRCVPLARAPAMVPGNPDQEPGDRRGVHARRRAARTGLPDRHFGTWGIGMPPAENALVRARRGGCPATCAGLGGSGSELLRGLRRGDASRRNSLPRVPQRGRNGAPNCRARHSPGNTAITSCGLSASASETAAADGSSRSGARVGSHALQVVPALRGKPGTSGGRAREIAGSQFGFQRERAPPLLQCVSLPAQGLQNVPQIEMRLREVRLFR